MILGDLLIQIGLKKDKLQADLNEVKKQGQTAAKSIETSFNSISLGNLSIEQLKYKLNQATASVIALTKEMEVYGKMGAAASRMNSDQIQATKLKLDEAKASVIAYKEQLATMNQQASTGFAQQSSLMNRIESNWGRLLIRLAGYGLAFKALFTIRDAIKDVEDFGKGMAYANTIMKVGTDQLKYMGDQVEVLQQKYGIGQNDLTAALYQLVSAGVSTKDALSVLEVASEASVAGVTDVKTAINGLTAVLNAFHLPASQANDVFDVMFKTVKLGKVTFAELANNYSKFTTTAEQLGVSFIDVSAAMATMTKESGNAEQASTRLGAIFNAILKKQESAKNMGIEVANAFSLQALQSKGLQKYLEDLYTILNGNSVALAKLFGNQRAVLGVLQLTGSNAKDAAAHLKEVTDRLGEMGKAYDIMSDTMSKANDRMSESWDVFLKRLVRPLQGPLTTGMNLYSQLFDWMYKIGSIKTQGTFLAFLADKLGIIDAHLQAINKYKQSVQELNNNVIPGTSTPGNAPSVPLLTPEQIQNAIKKLYDYLKYNSDNYRIEYKKDIDKQVEIFREAGAKQIDIKKYITEKWKDYDKGYFDWAQKQLEEYLFKTYGLTVKAADVLGYKGIEKFTNTAMSPTKQPNQPFPEAEAIKNQSLEQRAERGLKVIDQFRKHITDLNNSAELTDNLAGSIATGFEDAGKQMANSIGSAIHLFGQANSILQQFLQTLIQVTAQMFIWAAIKAGLTAWNPLGLFGAQGGSFDVNASSVRKLAYGGAMMIPQGFPNDSFPLYGGKLRVQSQELVKVYTPAQQQANMRDYADLARGINTVNTSVKALNLNVIKLNQKPLRVDVFSSDPYATAKADNRVKSQLSRGNVKTNV